MGDASAGGRVGRAAVRSGTADVGLGGTLLLVNTGLDGSGCCPLPLAPILTHPSSEASDVIDDGASPKLPRTTELL